MEDNFVETMLRVHNEELLVLREVLRQRHNIVDSTEIKKRVVAISHDNVDPTIDEKHFWLDFGTHNPMLIMKDYIIIPDTFDDTPNTITIRFQLPTGIELPIITGEVLPLTEMVDSN